MDIWSTYLYFIVPHHNDVICCCMISVLLSLLLLYTFYIRLRYRLTRFKYLLPGEKLDRHKNSPCRYISGFQKNSHLFNIYRYSSLAVSTPRIFIDLNYIFRFHFFLLENENILLSRLSKHVPLLLYVEKTAAESISLDG